MPASATDLAHVRDVLVLANLPASPGPAAVRAVLEDHRVVIIRVGELDVPFKGQVPELDEGSIETHNVGPISGRAGTEPPSTDRNYTAGAVRCIGGLSLPPRGRSKAPILDLPLERVVVQRGERQWPLPVRLAQFRLRLRR